MAAKTNKPLTKERLLSLFHVLLFLIFPAAVVSRSTVRYLPGFSGLLPFELETGYVSVDESNDAQYFYYFIKSERNPSEDPLLLWLSGGPGCSGFAGLVFEIGPLKFKVEEYNGSLPTLMLNPYSWTKVASIIFLDQPVGSGFSYSRSLQGSVTGVTISAKQTYIFLRKWLIDHPEFLLNPLYVAGDSYSGITVPVVAQYISHGLEAKDQPLINLKGYLLGNPLTDKKIDSNAVIPFAHGMGLISHELYKATKTSCEGEYVNVSPKNSPCLQNLQAISGCISRINEEQILEPYCGSDYLEQSDRKSFKANSRELLFSPGTIECRVYEVLLVNYWANDVRVQNALHIRKGTVKEWKKCNFDIPFIYDVTSTIEYHSNLSSRGYRSLIYSGDHDMRTPNLGTQEWIRSLEYSIIDEWRPWLVDRQVAGYTRTYSNSMTFATVKGGGHTAPEYKPKECFAMFKRWIFHQSL